MKLWLLRPVEGLPDSGNPWEPWYDKAFGFVVRAQTESEAREIAHQNSGDEKREANGPSEEPWRQPQFSTCVELTHDGPEGVVICDFHSA